MAGSGSTTKATRWHVYMVRCGDTSLYTGIATDVARRFEQHAAGLGARYLRGRGPLKLVYELEVGTRSDALKTELRIKRLPRARKEDLLTNRSPVVHDLNSGCGSPTPR